MGSPCVQWARLLGLAGGDTPGIIIVGGSQFSTSLAEAFKKHDVEVLVADANRGRLRSAREAGVPVFYGDILSEAAEHGVELMSFGRVVAASDNEAYNTLVATDLAPEFGRDNVFQLKQSKQENKRHQLPPTLGGRSFAAGKSFLEIARHMGSDWRVKSTGLTEDFDLESWREINPDAIPLAELDDKGALRLLDESAKLNAEAGTRIFWFGPDIEGDKPAKPGCGRLTAGASPMTR